MHFAWRSFVRTTTFAAALVTSVVAAPRQQVETPSTRALHEKRAGHDVQRWIKRDRPPPDTVLSMRVGLTQSNIENGYDLLMDVSHPDSPNYGRHYSTEQITELFAPTDGTVRRVKSWLIDYGIRSHRIAQSGNKGWLSFDAKVDEAESLLHTTFFMYEHLLSGAKTISCEEYYLPQAVQKHIDFVTPGVQLIAPAVRVGDNSRNAIQKKRATSGISPLKIDFSSPKVNPNNTSTCDVAITPACIKALYQIPQSNLSHTGNALGIFESGSMYSQKDLNLFFANFTPGIPKGTHPTLDSIDGGEAPVSVNLAGAEADLDFELAYPIVWPQKITLYQTDDQYYSREHYTGGIFNTFLDAIDGSYCNYSAFGETGDSPVFDPVYPDTSDPSGNGYQGKTMCGKYKLTNVISISYGLGEAYLPYYYQQRQCNEFMKLGLQGHTVLFASGDGGVESNAGDGNANGCLGPESNVFNPPYPANCPYVTSVGATKVYPGQTVSKPESAANDPAGPPYYVAFSSGGCFSNVYSAPAYQKSALNTYFSKHDPGYKWYSGLHNATHNSSTAIGAGGGVYNRIGRGVPDVSANGDNIAIYNGGFYGTTGGTSASTPIFAAVVNLINEHRLAAGRSTVGFLNPALYAYPQMLNDITNGSNPGCGTNGFSAVPGWDPVTGLGTPNFPKMLARFMSLP